jgi:hypothetical protein
MPTPGSAVFLCDRCGAIAGGVSILRPGDADPHAPRPGSPGHIPGLDTLNLFGGDRLTVVGPMGAITHGFVGRVSAQLETAIAASDAEALYRLNSEYATFWCPTCRLCYCEACWRVYPIFDDGFYDETRGVCPNGHDHRLDD